MFTLMMHVPEIGPCGRSAQLATNSQLLVKDYIDRTNIPTNSQQLGIGNYM